MKAERQDFDEWFAAQHGPRPGGTPDEELPDIIRAGDLARALYRLRMEWDYRRTSALYAWQVPDSSKARRVKR